MPVPKSVRRAARKVNPSPGSKQATQVQAVSGTFTMKVNSAKLKESKKGPYRSITGIGDDGKFYWAPLDHTCKPAKGQILTLKGEMKGTFGGEDGAPLYHKIIGPQYFPEVVSLKSKGPEGSEVPHRESLKFESGDAEALHETLETLVKQLGIGKILAVLGEIHVGE